MTPSERSQHKKDLFDELRTRELEWLHRIRGYEFELGARWIEPDTTGRVLEIGFGDGYLTSQLRERFKCVIPIDISPRANVRGMIVGSGETIPFRNGTFSLIYSSNVLEHVGDICRCMKEMRRVLADDGLMIHTMPTSTWKLAQLGGNPTRLVRGIVRRIRNQSGLRSDRDLNGKYGTGTSRLASVLSRVKTALWPPIHGVSESHFEEWNSFRSRYWTRVFTANGFQVIDVVPLLFYSTYNFLPHRLMSMRRCLARVGLGSCNAYVVRKDL